MNKPSRTIMQILVGIVLLIIIGLGILFLGGFIREYTGLSYINSRLKIEANSWTDVRQAFSGMFLVGMLREDALRKLIELDPQLGKSLTDEQLQCMATKCCEII